MLHGGHLLHPIVGPRMTLSLVNTAQARATPLDADNARR